MIHPKRSRGATIGSGRVRSSLFFLTMAASVSATSTSSPRCLYEPVGDSSILAGMDRMSRMDYPGADSAFDAALPAGSRGLAYFRGLNQMSRFNDRGDTAALNRAESLWTIAASDRFMPAPRKASGGRGDSIDRVNIDLYRGLSTLQLSYVANLTGRGVRAAHLGRKAAAQLRPHAPHRAEAEAALALYDYYKAALLKGVDWLPFVKADAAGPLRRLERSLPESRYLRDVLQTSLLWLYYDAGRHAEGLALIDAFLARHPGNRIYRAIRADFHFRRAAPGDLEEAARIHEALRAEYEALMAACPPPSCLPIGYLSSVGNLIKAYGRLGQVDLRRKYVGIWSSSKFEPYLSWLPGSLRREVDSQRK